MEIIISNVKAILPFFLVSWGIFLFSVVRRPQKLRNCYLFMIALFFSAVLLTGLFGDFMGHAMLFLFLLTMVVLFMVPVMLIINGVQLIRKEGRSLSHMLSLLLGVIIGFGEICAVAGVLSSADWIIPSRFGIAIGFLFATVLYFSIVMLSFVMYILFIQWMPHRMNFDYIIIHGAGLVQGNRIGRLLGNRIDKAIEIYHRCGDRPILIPSGGKGSDEDLSEAEAMKNYLLEKGIPEASILMEDRSTTTRENLIYSKRLIEEAGGADRIALVSSNYHVYRCLRLAAQLKMHCTGIGANVALYYWPSAVIREFVAIYTQKKHLILMILGYVFFVVLPTIGMMQL